MGLRLVMGGIHLATSNKTTKEADKAPILLSNDSRSYQGNLPDPQTKSNKAQLGSDDTQATRINTMKISAVAFAGLLALQSLSGGNAFALPRTSHGVGSSSSSRLESMVTHSTGTGKGGRSEDEINAELSSGKILEGGKVIDFESVKGPSKAEQALAESKRTLANRSDRYVPSVQSGILGINEDVVAEVGHDLGKFATLEDVQACATYLRSRAPNGLFELRPEQNQHQWFSDADINKFEALIRKAYEESGEVTSAFAKTFYLGTQLLPEAPREAIWAIYVWCRRTDEIVDAPRDNDEEMLFDLASWELRLERMWKHGDVEDVYDLCLLDVLTKYPSLPITPFMDMIRGMLMDVPDLGQDRYENFDELHLYCYRVAGTVGLMSLPIFGCAPGFNEDVAREPALSLGVAFQLTNILRDVGEDAVQRGRVYLPKQDMERFGVTEEQIFAQRVDENYIEFMKFQIARARMYYKRARRGVFMLAPESRLPVQSSLDAYGRILDKIEENGYDSLTTRAYVDKWEKLSIIPFSFYRTLDVSRYLPLLGDERVESLTEI